MHQEEGVIGSGLLSGIYLKSSAGRAKLWSGLTTCTTWYDPCPRGLLLPSSPFRKPKKQNKFWGGIIGVMVTLLLFSLLAPLCLACTVLEDLGGVCLHSKPMQSKEFNMFLA